MGASDRERVYVPVGVRVDDIAIGIWAYWPEHVRSAANDLVCMDWIVSIAITPTDARSGGSARWS